MREKIVIRISSFKRFYEVIGSIVAEVDVSSLVDGIIVTPKDGVTEYVFKPEKNVSLQLCAAKGAAEMLRHINERYPARRAS